MSDVDVIKNNHLTMIAAANALLLAVRKGYVPCEIGRLRLNLANAVREKLLLQQQCLSQIPEEVRTAIPTFAEIMLEDRELRLSYSHHIAKWHARSIEADFSAYVQSVETLVSRMKRHLRRLEFEILERIERADGFACRVPAWQTGDTVHSRWA